jgi:hypothetical protein
LGERRVAFDDGEAERPGGDGGRDGGGGYGGPLVGAYGLPACGEDGRDGQEVVPAFVPVGFYGGVDGFASGFAS